MGQTECVLGAVAGVGREGIVLRPERRSASEFRVTTLFQESD